MRKNDDNKVNRGKISIRLTLLFVDQDSSVSFPGLSLNLDGLCFRGIKG